jgi:hypothetical protein
LLFQYKTAKVRYTVKKRNCYFTEFIIYGSFEEYSESSVMEFLREKHSDADEVSISEIVWGD